MLLSYSKKASDNAYKTIITDILTKIPAFCKSFTIIAAVVKLADALDSKSSGLIPRVGSSPTSGTKHNKVH